MSDRRTFLRGLVSLPLIGGGVTLIGRPAAAVPLVQAAALPTFDDPRQRARYAWEAFSAAMGDLTADADGWRILGGGEMTTPLPGAYPGTGRWLRLAAVHYVDERKPGASRPFTVDRSYEIALDPAEEALIREREAWRSAGRERRL